MSRPFSPIFAVSFERGERHAACFVDAHVPEHDELSDRSTGARARGHAAVGAVRHLGPTVRARRRRRGLAVRWLRGVGAVWCAGRLAPGWVAGNGRAGALRLGVEQPRGDELPRMPRQRERARRGNPAGSSRSSSATLRRRSARGTAMNLSRASRESSRVRQSIGSRGPIGRVDRSSRSRAPVSSGGRVDLHATTRSCRSPSVA